MELEAALEKVTAYEDGGARVVYEEDQGCDDTRETCVTETYDAAGNAATFSDTILYDSNAPSGSVLINGGDADTNEVAVTLSISCNDLGSGCAYAEISNDGGLSWNAVTSDLSTQVPPTQLDT